MREQLELEFEKADQILSAALEKFQDEKVSQHVWAMALLEVGVTALVKVDTDEHGILKSVTEFIQKAK